MKRAPRQRQQPISFVRYFGLLASMLAMMVVAGCAGIPSKMYTSKDFATFAGAEPTRCDTFTYGQHPHVVIQLIANVPEATLEILTNGTVINQRTIPLHSPRAVKSPITSDINYSAHGVTVDLGVIAAGSYDLKLKTNNIVAATARFKVVLPARLEALREEIESDRVKLEGLVNEIKQMNAEIELDKSKLDLTNQAMVDAFNAKIASHDQLVHQAEAARDELNSRIQAYNNGLRGQQRQIPPF